MSDETTNITETTEELIDVPSFLSEDDGVAIADVCWTNAEGCYDNMYGPCCQGLLCQDQSICVATCEKVCQNCQGVSCQTCQDTCQTACQSACMYACQNCQTTCELSSQRPSNFTWTSEVSKGAVVTNINGSPAYLTAIEWNDFTAKINSFRIYKGLSTATFTEAVTGEPMRATQINEAIEAINAMSPASPTPIIVSSGESIMAETINGLATALNSIA